MADWIYVQTGEIPCRFFRRRFKQSYGQVLACEVIGREAYIAYESYKSGEREVFAVVCLLDQTKPNELGYKPMSEDSGPYYYNCPERILDLLTDATHAWAMDWRRKCRERIAEEKLLPRLPKGMTIEFEKNIHFRSGIKARRFIVCSGYPLRFNPMVETADGWQTNEHLLCRIKASTLCHARVVESESPELKSAS